MTAAKKNGVPAWVAGWLAIGFVGLLSISVAHAQTRELVIFAAASMKNSLDDAAANYARENGKPMPKISYAASNTLAKQIEAGAPADVFVSADLDWMDYLAAKKLVRPETRLNLLANRIVLVAPKGTTIQVNLAPGLDLAAALKDGRLAMANVDAVPAGKYGKAALEKLGAWDGVKSSIAQADNVRGALLLVSRGEASLGIVYQTDAASDPNVRIIATFPQDSHPPIVYPVAVTKDSTHADAAAFVTWLRSATVRPSFEKQGFTILDQPATGS
jgi:molybdate transport system substrate-binding protein